MNRRAQGLLWVLGLVWMAGCAHTPKALPTGLQPDAFWKEQAARSGDTKQVSSRIYFRYESKKQNLGGQGKLVLQAPGALRMELRDPLGRLQYVATLSEKDFVARYPRQNVAYVDTASGGAYLRRVLGVHVSFHELRDLLVGLIPETLRKNKFDTWEWSDEEGTYVGTFHWKGKRVQAGVDGTRATLTWLKVDGGKPADTAMIRYTDFDSCCNLEGNGQISQFPLARNVALQMSETGTTVSVEWEDVQSFREPKPSEVFKAELPQQTKKVMLN